MCVAFFAMGMAQTSIGPALPDLARQTHSSIVAAGGALAAMFAGSLGGFTTSGLLLRRLGRRRLMIAGMSPFVIGAAGVATSTTLALLLTAGVCMGFGFATVVLVGNLLAAEASRGAGPLNLVNALFGVGAIVSPALIGASMAILGTGVPVLWMIPSAMAIGLCLLLFWAPRSAESEQRIEREVDAGRRSAWSVLGSPQLWTFCGLMFAYQSIEIGIGGWLPTLLERSVQVPPAAGALAVSWVWLLMTAVRFVAAWASRFTRPEGMLKACVGVTIFGGTLLVACVALGSPALGLAAASVLGLAMGPITPSLLALVRSAFSRDPGTATGLVMAVGSIGSAVMPWVLGALIVDVGPLSGAGLLLTLPLSMTVLLAAIPRQTRTTPSPVPASIASEP